MEKEKVFGRYDEETLVEARRYFGCGNRITGIGGCYLCDRCPIALGYEINEHDNSDLNTLTKEKLANECPVLYFCDGYQTLLNLNKKTNTIK